MTNLSENDYINQLDELTKRYIESERFLMEIIETPWYKRIFIKSKIIKFLNNILSKYNF